MTNTNEFHEVMKIGRNVATAIGIQAGVESGKWVAEIVIGVLRPSSTTILNSLAPQLGEPITIWHSSDRWDEMEDAMIDGRKQLVDCLSSLFSSRHHGAAI